MEFELQHGRCFAAGWRILPILQCLFDGINEYWMTANGSHGFDVSVGGDHHLHLHNSGKAKLLRYFGIRRRGICNRLAPVLGRQICADSIRAIAKKVRAAIFVSLDL